MNELALFAGAGGGILGGHLLGWTTVCAVEIEKYPREVLLQRQRDGILKPFPIWDDICTFDGRPWKGAVDIISGGFPCQDISAAGKGIGITGERSGLWKEMSRVVCEVRPRLVFVENSPMLTGRGLNAVLGDLAAMGYDARWCVLGADDAGANHRRKRSWILAYRNGQWELQQERIVCNEWGRISDGSKNMAYPDDPGLQRGNVRKTEYTAPERLSPECRKITWWDTDPADLPDTGSIGLEGGNIKRVCGEGFGAGVQSQSTGIYSSQNTWSTQPRLGRVAHGVANRVDFFETAFGGKIPRVAHGIDKRVDRLKAIGNGQVPVTAAMAFIILSEGLR